MKATTHSTKGQSRLTVLVCGLGVSVLSLESVALASQSHPAPSAQDLLSIVKPAPIPESSWSPSKLLAMAFLDADLGALLRDSGSANCFTQDMRALPYDGAGRVSARNCVSSLEQGYYERFSSVVAVRPTQEVGLPNYKTNNMDMNLLGKTTANRLATRLVTSSVKRNEFLRTLVEGKVDVKFSLRDLDSLGSSFAPVTQPRPTYQLAVNYRESSVAPVRVASLGSSAQLIKPSSASFHKPPVAEQKIVEVWPAPAAPVAEASTVETSSTDLSFSKKIQRTFGLAAEPLSQFRLKLERGGAAGGTGALSLRLEDTSGLGALDLTGLMQGRSDGVAWEMRLPYKNHAAVLTRDNLSMMNRYVYEYTASAAMRTRFAYDPNTPEGVVPDAAHGKYSVGLSYSF
jgi:hypothetical protein